MAFDTFELNDFKWSLKNGKVLNIFFFGDTHDCAKDSDDEYLKRMEIEASKLPFESCLFLGMGDYGDFASTTERKSIRHAGLHDTTMDKLDGEARDDLERRIERLEFMRGRIVGLHNGNHDWEFSDGKYASEIMAERLGCRHLGYSAHTRVAVSNVINKNWRSNVTIFSSHGKGSGKLLGSPWNSLEQMSRVINDADLFCMSDDTEILTSRGWLGIDELTLQDEAITFDIKDGSIKHSPILNKIEFPYNGKAVHLKNRNVDCLMHPEHRVLYRHNKNWRFTEAKRLVNMEAQIKIPLAGKSNGNVDLSDDIISLCGWIVSEGSFGPSGIRITQKPGKKSDMIRDNLVRSGLDFTENDRIDNIKVFYIRSNSCGLLRSIMNNCKAIPRFVFECSDRQFELFLTTLTLGDGTTNGKNGMIVYQKDETFIDDLQSACLQHGFRGLKRFKKGGFKDGGWHLSLVKRTEFNCALSKRQAKEVDYKGRMWCISTDQTTVIARRNGTEFITGNCMGHDHSLGSIPDTRLKVVFNAKTNKSELKEIKRLFIRTGSSLRGYVPGKRSYISKALYKPCSMGFPKAIVEWRRDCSGGENHIIKELHSYV